MNKLTAITLSIATISTLTFAAEDAATTTDTSSVQTVKENTGEGFYIGAGVGASFYNISSSDGTYYLPDEGDGSQTIVINDLENLDDNDVGYLFYGGYQFNKIIAVEAAYTDYGSFSDQVTNRLFTKDPYSVAVYANAGYTFFNGQLRPFGLLGVGYLQSNQSKAYDIQGIANEFATLHTGLGVDYYPTVLKGFGVRASYTSDMYIDSDYVVFDEADVVTTTSLWQQYGLFYVGAQYKF